MLNKEKGITLIALIITIIVMLILVGVTINVALSGGLFTKAQEATRQTEENAILEEMIAMMEITDNGKINSAEIISKMREKYPTLQYNETTNIATIVGKLGTYSYIVSETEIKIGIEKDNLALLKEDLENKYVNDVMVKGVFNNTEIQLVSGSGTSGIISFRGEQYIITTDKEGEDAKIISVERYTILEEDTPNESIINYNKAYVGTMNGADFYTIFIEDGTMKTIIPSLNYVITTNYEIKETATVTINSEELTFNNAIFTGSVDSEGNSTEELKFGGYIPGDGDIISIHTGGLVNSDGSISGGEWQDCTLNISIDVSQYL